MIHYSRLVGTLRFYPPEAGATPYEDMADYVAVGTVVWETEDTIFINGLHGAMTRAMQRELLDWLIAHGIKRVKAHRAPQRSLPFARRVDDHEEIEVADLVARFKESAAPKQHRRADDPPA